MRVSIRPGTEFHGEVYVNGIGDPDVSVEFFRGLTDELYLILDWSARVPDFPKGAFSAADVSPGTVCLAIRLGDCDATLTIGGEPEAGLGRHEIQYSIEVV